MSGRDRTGNHAKRRHTFPPLFFVPERRGDGQKQNL